MKPPLIVTLQVSGIISFRLGIAILKMSNSTLQRRHKVEKRTSWYSFFIFLRNLYVFMCLSVCPDILLVLIHILS